MTSNSDFAHSYGEDLPEATDVVMDGVSRRSFLGIVGAGAAFAGVGLSGCIRKPVTKIVPFANRPEDIVEGVALFFATAYQEGTTVTGIVVESHEGRPTKIAGNKAHPESLGATNATTQASVLGLYDLDRSVLPHGQHRAEDATHDSHGPGVSWEHAWTEFDKLAAEAKTQPIAIVLPTVMSPTMRRLLVEAKAAFPAARFFRSDLLYPQAAMTAAAALAGDGAYALTHLDKADVLASFDADVLGREPDAVRMTKGYAQKRRVTGPGQPMSRIYAVEPGFTTTGATADHRARVKAADVGNALALLAAELGKHGVTVDANAMPQSVRSAGALALDPKTTNLVLALAKDLAANRAAAVVCVGVRQPPWVHALGYAINAALGTAAQTWHRDPAAAGGPAFESLAALATDAKSFGTIFAIDANPAHTSAGELKLAEVLASSRVVHAGLHDDETGKLAFLHLPISHYLEAWGDLASLTGATTIQQPLIEPLHHTPSALEVFGRLVRGKSVGGHELVRETWKVDDASWETWLHDGVRIAPLEAPTTPSDFAKLVALQPTVPTTPAPTEIVFELDPNLLDGRFANNAWMRELPHPMSKLTWDNAALVNKATAGQMKNGDMVVVTVNAKSVEMPLQMVPGIADGVVVVALGAGRKGIGKVADQHGFDAYPLLPARHEAQGWFAGGSIAAGNGAIRLANVQKFGITQTPRAQHGFGPRVSPDTYDKYKNKEIDETFEPRLVALVATLDQYKATPDFPDKLNDRIMPDEKVKSWMYPERPNEKPLVGGATTDDTYLNGVHQWGMSIDLNACTGCNACTVACQAENNIVTVGKEQVLNGREMHWIRIDRYYSGSEDEPEATLQPLPCQQCETAPCEAVCPVKATAHSNEGLNDMVYNRCIGTRYCSNNCPFKVRRFNWFNFNLDLHPLEQMQKNPDVTVRFRGVMEKCTYCVQRINRAKIASKLYGNGKVQDGEITPACAEVCPADAIVFGDLRDPDSAVTRAKSEPRTYQLLRDLNMRARTTYLAKLKNPNPDLV